MELHSSDCIKILNKNFEFEIVETVIGKAIKMDCFDAFLFSNVTGAVYLDNTDYPFSPKGLLKVFYNAFNYNFVTGLFDKSSLRNTPLLFSKRYPQMFVGNKYIVFAEFDSEKEYNEIISNYYYMIKNSGENPENFIVHRIEKRKTGNGMEPFMEYLTCEVFKSKGFIVENQIPLAHTVGSPDFGGYKTDKDIGFHILEFALIRLRREAQKKKSITIQSAIVGEAKTSTKIMAKQLEKYLNTSLFDIGYEIHPCKLQATYSRFGLITLNDDYSIRVEMPTEEYSYDSSHYDRQEYFNWLEKYISYYLLANFTNDELNDYCMQRIKTHIRDESDLIKLISSVSMQDIITYIEEEL